MLCWKGRSEISLLVCTGTDMITGGDFCMILVLFRFAVNLHVVFFWEHSMNHFQHDASLRVSRHKFRRQQHGWAEEKSCLNLSVFATIWRCDLTREKRRCNQDAQSCMTLLVSPARRVQKNQRVKMWGLGFVWGWVPRAESRTRILFEQGDFQCLAILSLPNHM